MYAFMLYDLTKMYDYMLYDLTKMYDFMMTASRKSGCLIS